MRFLNKTPITVYRRHTDDEGYLGEDGRWVYDVQEDAIPIRCSLQPYIREGNDKEYLPEGIKAEDSLYLFTKTEIFTSDDRLKKRADEVEVYGYRYQCIRVKNYTGFGLRTDHYECVFVRKDKLGGGQ